MRLDSIYTLESTLPYSMHQMGSLSGAFPLIIPFQCYAPTPCWRNLTEKKKGERELRGGGGQLKYRSILSRGKLEKIGKQKVSNTI